MERTCRKCGETKPIEEFVKVGKIKIRYYTLCKKCNKECCRIYYANNIKKERKRIKDYHLKNRKSIAKRRRLFYEQNREQLSYRNKKSKKRNAEELSNQYMVGIIHCSTGLKATTIRNHPELIENYRKQIELIRLLKSKKNDKSIETS